MPVRFPAGSYRYPASVTSPARLASRSSPIRSPVMTARTRYPAECEIQAGSPWAV
jgi:hypothetical protein